MTTAAETALAEAFQKLTAEIARLDPDKAQDMRKRMTLHLNTMATVAVSKAPKCAIHSTEPAHSCAPCRGEAIGRAHDDPLPETPEAARLIDARRIGEREEREHRI